MAICFCLLTSLFLSVGCSKSSEPIDVENAVDTESTSDVESTVSAISLQDVSSLTEEECILYVKQKGIDIPDFLTEEEWAPCIRSCIFTAARGFRFSVGISYTVTHDFCYAIEDAVFAELGIDPP